MSGIMELYKDIMENKSHPITKDWFLISGPGPVTMIIVSYLYFSLSAGPRYMKDKKPYELRIPMIVYNFIQVLFSIYIFYEGLMAGWLYDYNYYCQPVDYTDNPLSRRMANAVHFYFTCKLIELLDTVFFVLRKKNRQISSLHVYHHALMPICGWIGCRFLPNGHGTLLGVINAFIHIIMYMYYMLASIGPHMNKYLWWKKYLTSLQLIQFCIIFVHTFQIFFNGCNYPVFLTFLLNFNSLVFIYLFGSFYIENYIKNKEQKKNKTEKITKTANKME
ncbi:elongation of very long chain fatty acids protein 7-like [Apis cerana]|nr:elongation of very long chain fatty acids protein 7-like [Apis cerana]XP_016916380.1 elongation of very long chain fatty acids protein 7-like [Apis cerana]XP_061942366.1 elongation of very long chain fatty acids protein 7-like [Apis cerana]XP_061942368.1 elongation of very long chain fatty acids protein 7-like [Apis cerana]